MFLIIFYLSIFVVDLGVFVWGVFVGVFGRNYLGSGMFIWGNIGIWNID